MPPKHYPKLDADGFVTPRTMTAHLCKACGAVAFDWLANAGFLSNATEFHPGPPGIGKRSVPPLPPVKCRNCSGAHKTGDCDQPPGDI